MAEIKAATNEKVFQITAFKGLNQAPDGDTKLKLGEAAESYNFRVTRDGNLQRRPGTKTIIDLFPDAGQDIEVIYKDDLSTAGYIASGEGDMRDIGIENDNDGEWHIASGDGEDYELGVEGSGQSWHMSAETTPPSYNPNGKPIKGLWTGYVNGKHYMLGACDNALYKLWDEDAGFGAVALVPEAEQFSTEKDVHIFGFQNIAYILDGSHYWQWDGETLEQVAGYRPLVRTAIPPVGAASDESASLENVNRLTGSRRVWLSPDGEHATFKIPEAPADLDYVEFIKPIPVKEWQYANGELTFTEPPAEAVDAIEVGYTVSTAFRSDVENMQYAELFSGVHDTRVFLYGDGTNKTIYSGMDHNGRPRADYFPDLYEALVGDENTPITAMIRHYSSLACFKTDSAWSISANSLTLAEGLKIPAFYVSPVNKEIGNEAPGQVSLILNSPYTLFGNDLYEWKNNSYYTSNLTRDERQARRISDRVWATLKGFHANDCVCYDDNSAQEYYICHDEDALVYNYAADAWSRYANFRVSSMANIGDDLYIGTPDGKLKHFSADYLNDDGTAIDAYWESGSMSFGQEYMRKYSAMTWLSVKPESKTELVVSVRTDKKLCEEKTITTEAYQFDFGNLDFDNFKFDEYYGAQVYREKIKAKKFVFYKLLLACRSENVRCTVLSADIRVRFTGMAK